MKFTDEYRNLAKWLNLHADEIDRLGLIPDYNDGLPSINADVGYLADIAVDSIDDPSIHTAVVEITLKHRWTK